MKRDGTSSIEFVWKQGAGILSILVLASASLAQFHPDTDPATLPGPTDDLTDHLGTQQTGTGKGFIFDGMLDQPFTIHIERARVAQVDTLELRERANDIARSGGRASVYDATGTLGNPPLVGIGLTTNRQVEVTWPNSPRLRRASGFRERIAHSYIAVGPHSWHWLPAFTGGVIPER